MNSSGPPVVSSGLLAAFQILVMAAVLFGNFLVLMIMVRHQSLRTITHFFVASLALADLMVGLVMPFHVLVYLQPAYLSSRHVCLFRYVSILLPCGASLGHVLCITVDRYLAIVYPLRYAALLTFPRALVLSLVVWLDSLVLGSVILAWNNWRRGEPCRFTRVVTWQYVAFVLDLYFFGVCLLVTGLYCRILRVASRQRRKIKSEGQTADDEATTKGVRSLKIYGLVVSTFCLCWIPFFIVISVQVFWFNTATLNDIGGVTVIIGLCNSVINPIIYGCTNRDFRNAYKTLFHCKRSRLRTCAPHATTDL